MNVLGLPALDFAPVFAYIGPGIGVGTLAVVLGFIASILLAVFAVLWYPLKRLFKRRRKKPLAEGTEES
jgi:hypothetical protein